MDATMYLLDREFNTIHDFENGEYTFTATAGTDSSRFALINRHNATTALDNLNSQYLIQTTEDGIFVHGNAYLQVFNAAGQTIVDGQVSGNLPLAPGVYMVVANGNTTKHIIY
jgi:hypothetical protein